MFWPSEHLVEDYFGASPTVLDGECQGSALNLHLRGDQSETAPALLTGGGSFPNSIRASEVRIGRCRTNAFEMSWAIRAGTLAAQAQTAWLLRHDFPA